MRFAIATLGCKTNQYESQRLREGLVSAGHTEHPFSEPGADWYIINTCTVTHRSDSDARKLIRRALRQGGRVVVTGCQAVVYPQEISAISDEVAVALPDQLRELFGIDLPSSIAAFNGHSRPFVKVQEGCSMSCAYCIVPRAKGKPVSRPWGDVISEMEALYTRGYREIVLTGINIGLYEGGMARLLEKILAHTRIPRIRISSLEPWTVEDALIEMVINEPRVCKHLHLPLQHGSDHVLKAMGRPYTSSYFSSLVNKISSGSDEIAIGMDIIAGFPGEDDESFEESYRFIEDMHVSYLHVFPFSPRPGTLAAGMGGKVGNEKVRWRARRLRNLSREKRQAFAHSRIGFAEEVLVTKVCPGFFFGITSHYLMVQVPGKASEGDIVRVMLLGLDGTALRGEFLG